MTRNFKCPMTGSLCEEPGCKRTLCVLEREIASREGEHLALEASKFRKEAEKVAREWCKDKAIRPTETQLRKLMRHPAVIKEARRRVEFAASL
jgi:hypothetical protein